MTMTRRRKTARMVDDLSVAAVLEKVGEAFMDEIDKALTAAATARAAATNNIVSLSSLSGKEAIHM